MAKVYSANPIDFRQLQSGIDGSRYLVTIRPGLQGQRGGRDVGLQQLQVQPIRLGVGSPLRQNPGGEEREDVERAEEAGRHGLADELPQRGRVVREAEVGDEDPRELRAGLSYLFGFPEATDQQTSAHTSGQLLKRSHSSF